MTKQEFLEYCLDTYGTAADYPFDEDFETAVLRHASNRKWYAVSMKVSRRKFGFESDVVIDVVNLKCAPEVIESLAGIETGIYKAYHMNKMHWLTVALSECDDDTISWLLGISYDLTRSKINRK